MTLPESTAKSSLFVEDSKNRGAIKNCANLFIKVKEFQNIKSKNK